MNNFVWKDNLKKSKYLDVTIKSQNMHIFNAL